MLDVNDVANFFIVTSGVLFTTTLGFAVLWLKTRERLIRTKMEQPREMPTHADEIGQLMNAVDSIAVEVERISEAQRFTAKVLGERPENAAPVKRVPERVITPH